MTKHKRKLAKNRKRRALRFRHEIKQGRISIKRAVVSYTFMGRDRVEIIKKETLFLMSDKLFS